MMLKEPKPSYGFYGKHKVVPKLPCYRCEHDMSKEKLVKIIVNDDLEKADAVCPKCGSLMGILYSRLDEFVERIKPMRSKDVAKAIIKDQRLRGKIIN